MMLRFISASAVVLPLFSVTAAMAEFTEPAPIGAGEILIQYETSKPTEAQIRACEKIGGQNTQLQDGTYVCARRSL